MKIADTVTRRGFLAVAAASAASLRAQNTKHIPVGLLIYAVLADWKKDFDGTLTAVAQMGYEGVELTQYESWTPARAHEVRALLDSVKLKTFASHTEPEFFVPGDKMKGMIELNRILGTQTICCVRGLANSVTPVANNPAVANNPPGANAAPGGPGNNPVTGNGQGKKGGGGSGAEIGYHPVKATNEADAWKELADVLQAAAGTMKRDRMAVSFHNHAVEFQTRGNGVGRPIDILAKAKDLTFHTDVNVATRAGSDVVAFIRRYPGKSDCLLLTDGPSDANRHAPALGKGDTPWKNIFAAAESVGGVKYYLLTHGATELTPLETVKRDLEQYKLIHG
jgi:sugar phosphate isomerase/epimerase